MWAQNSTRTLSKFLSFSSNLFINNVRKFAAAPKTSGASSATGKKRFRLPVETDTNKLINFCCGANYYKNGEDVKIKDDNEYPDWLWKLPLKPPRLHELDPNTKEYWEKASIVGQQREWKLRKILNKRMINCNPTYIQKMELKYRRRFRALAKYHYNAGYDIHAHHEREDTWNMHMKDKYELDGKDDDEQKPFYPGIDTLNFHPKMERELKYRKPIKKAGHFGQ